MTLCAAVVTRESGAAADLSIHHTPGNRRIIGQYDSWSTVFIGFPEVCAKEVILRTTHASGI